MTLLLLLNFGIQNFFVYVHLITNFLAVLALRLSPFVGFAWENATKFPNVFDVKSCEKADFQLKWCVYCA